MTRSFVALTLPQGAAEALVALQQHLPAPRLVPAQNLHLTLCFLGELENEQLEDLHDQLAGISAAPFDLAVSGLNVFGGARLRQVYCTLHPSQALADLHGAVTRAANRAGLHPPRRRFLPHVTLARLPAHADHAAISRFVAANAVLAGPTFSVAEYHFMSSQLRPNGAQYEIMASYPLFR